MYALHKSAEIAAHQSFNYALSDDAETALLGCVYLDRRRGKAGTGLERAVDALVPPWIAAAWPMAGRRSMYLRLPSLMHA
jgi:hypothetical protein